MIFTVNKKILLMCFCDVNEWQSVYNYQKKKIESHNWSKTRETHFEISFTEKKRNFNFRFQEKSSNMKALDKKNYGYCLPLHKT